MTSVTPALTDTTGFDHAAVVFGPKVHRGVDYALRQTSAGRFECVLRGAEGEGRLTFNVTAASWDDADTACRARIDRLLAAGQME